MPWPAERQHSGEPGGARSHVGAYRAARPARRHLRAVVGCEAVSEELPLVVDGTRRPSAAMADHLRGCSHCRAEMSSYQRLLATLRSLRDETLELPTGVFAAGPYIVERLVAERRLVARRSSGQSWLLAGALAVALVATGAAVAARRGGAVALGA